MIEIRPRETRFVDIYHESWGLDWARLLANAIPGFDQAISSSLPGTPVSDSLGHSEQHAN